MGLTYRSLNYVKILQKLIYNPTICGTILLYYQIYLVFFVKLIIIILWR